MIPLRWPVASWCMSLPLAPKQFILRRVFWGLFSERDRLFAPRRIRRARTTAHSTSCFCFCWPMVHLGISTNLGLLARAQAPYMCRNNSGFDFRHSRRAIQHDHSGRTNTGRYFPGRNNDYHSNGVWHGAETLKNDFFPTLPSSVSPIS